MKRLVLNRLENLEDRTLGILSVFNGLTLEATFYTLELPFKENAKNISCIHGGYYRVKPRHSVKYGNHLEIMSVLNRSDILMHHGNYPRDTQGCILIGSGFSDIDNDDLLEVINSKRAMKQLTDIVTAEAELFIL